MLSCTCLALSSDTGGTLLLIRFLSFIFLIGFQASLYADDFYLARWEWNDKDLTDVGWQSPGGDAIGSLDLRTYSQMVSTGGQGGYGIFVYKDTKAIPGSLSLGSVLSRVLEPNEISTIETFLGRRGIASVTVRDFMWDMVTIYSDPTGVTASKPVIGKLNGFVELNLGISGIVKSEPFDDTHRQRTVDVFKADYRRNKIDGVSLKDLRQWTARMMQDLYGIVDDETSEKLLPEEYKGDKWERPETVLLDDFNRADNATLTPSAEGWSWTGVDDNFTILTNEIIPNDNAGASVARAENALSSADQSVKLNVNVTGSGTRKSAGPAVRLAESANTFYGFEVHWSGAVWENRVRKTVAGTQTTLFTNSNNYNAVYVEAKFEINGSNISAKVDNVEIITGTDVSITGNLFSGITGRKGDIANVVCDDFNASDIAALGRRRMKSGFAR